MSTCILKDVVAPELSRFTNPSFCDCWATNERLALTIHSDNRLEGIDIVSVAPLENLEVCLSNHSPADTAEVFVAKDRKGNCLKKLR